VSADETIKALKELPIGLFEISQKSTFHCYRHKKDGSIQEVTIDIYDAGQGAGQVRFHCIATTDDGKLATGNAADTLETTISIVHWDDLDR
jgi:hypothetical protein